MLAARYHDVLAQVARACERAGRDPREVTLVAVGKTHPPATLRALYDLGQRDFGENRAQEMLAKAEALPADARFHFIGALQSNKARDVARVAARVHSFDRPDLAAAFARGPPLVLQVNLAREPQKRGIAPEEAPAALAAIRAAGATCDGLSAIPPAGESETATRARFRALAALRDALGLAHLSMGMSADYAWAIEEGATFVRVGTALFGERSTP